MEGGSPVSTKVISSLVWSIGEMKKIIRCIKCHSLFKGEHWQDRCRECYRMYKPLTRLVSARLQGAKLAATVDSRRCEVRKRHRNMLVILPDKERSKDNDCTVRLR